MGGLVIQARMWPDLIVVAVPVFDDDPSFQAIVELFHRQAFVAEFSVEAVVGAGVAHEVVTPNAIPAVRETRATLDASHRASFAFCRHLQTSLTPQAWASFFANLNAFTIQKDTNTTRTKTWVLPR